MVFVEQPLPLPGSAKYMLTTIILHTAPSTWPKCLVPVHNAIIFIYFYLYNLSHGQNGSSRQSLAHCTLTIKHYCTYSTAILLYYFCTYNSKLAY